MRCLSKRDAVTQPEAMGLLQELLGEILWPVKSDCEIRLDDLMDPSLSLASMNQLMEIVLQPKYSSCHQIPLFSFN